MRYANEIGLSGSAAVDIDGVVIDTANHVQISAQAVVTGTSTGTLFMQYSDDLVSPTNWSPMSSATVSIAGAGVYAIEKQDVCYRYVRLVFTHTNAASGTISATYKTNGY